VLLLFVVAVATAIDRTPQTVILSEAVRALCERPSRRTCGCTCFCLCSSSNSCTRSRTYCCICSCIRVHFSIP
jgi:hypothetical protein